MSDQLSFAIYKAKGWLAYNTIRWFPLPMFWRQSNPIYQLSARLWGIAYTAGAFPTFSEWHEHVRKPA